MTGQTENQVKMIRWSRPVPLPSGVISDICCRTGDMKEILEYAERVEMCIRDRLVLIPGVCL